jgi:hypothetical protein
LLFGSLFKPGGRDSLHLEAVVIYRENISVALQPRLVFMSGASVEYFATTDVLALMFENTSESPLMGRGAEAHECASVRAKLRNPSNERLEFFDTSHHSEKISLEGKSR